MSALSAKATFAGGCFWCVEAAFEDLKGVTSAISGFTGGALKNPTYQGDHRGHYEAVKVTYDPLKISYQKLLDTYWANIDPFDGGGQFCDKGFSYLSAIFVDGPNQKELAKASLQKVIALFPGKEVVTPILDTSIFYPVEDYHQDYYKKNPIRYKFYRTRCKRDARLRDIWGDIIKQ